MLKSTTLKCGYLLCAAFVFCATNAFPLTYEKKGVASFYFKPQKTASGKWFTPNKMWCAHRSLPLGTKLKVTNIKNGKSVVVTCWDRGPFIKNRIIDLSKSAFARIADVNRGLVEVHIQVLD